MKERLEIPALLKNGLINRYLPRFMMAHVWLNHESAEIIFR